MKKFVCVFLAMAVALLPCLYGLALPAAALDGDSAFLDVEPSGDEDPGNNDPGGDPGGDPGTNPDPPVTDPTDPPVVDPTAPPVVDDPTAPPEDNPTPPPVEDPTPPPDGADPTPGAGDSTPEPTEEPSSSEPSGGGDNGGGDSGGNGGSTWGTTDYESSSSTPRVPGGVGGTQIQQPSFSPRATVAPAATPAASSQGDTSSVEPRYITFARVNQKNNSMSVVLFYSGASCIGVGALGLVLLAVFIIRGRRIDERDGIFQEIAEAETRQPLRPVHVPPQTQAQAMQGKNPPPDYAPPRGDTGENERLDEWDDGYAEEPAPGYAAPQGYESLQSQNSRRSLYSPDPEALAVPMNGSLYTEEFELPQQDMYSGASMYTEEFDPPAVSREAPQPVVPSQEASMYTEEFVLPEEGLAQPSQGQQPAQFQRPQASPRGQSAPPPRRGAPQPPQERTESFDTTELLREILYGEDGEQR